MTQRIGFLGAGSMGGGMIRRLLQQGHAVTLWERTAGRHAELHARGATLEPHLQAVVERADVVIGCLLNTDVTRTCYLGAHGALAAARPGQVFIDHGTFDPALAEELATVARRAGAHFLDAPVTGGPERATDGTLVTMVGGDAAVLDGVRAIITAYCGDIAWVGASGSGQRLKLINQLLVSIHVVAAAEASALLLRSGIDTTVAHRVLMGGWASSAMLDRELPRACAGQFGDSGATVGKLVEVQPLIAALLQQAGIHSQLFAPTRNAFNSAMTSGAEHLDLAAIVSQYLTQSADHLHVAAGGS